MFRVEVFLQEMLEKIANAELLLQNDAINPTKNSEKTHIIK